MQFAAAPSGLRQIAQIRRLLFARTRLVACTADALLVDEAIEIGHADGPAIALVLDEAMDAAERAALVALHELEAAEQRRRVGEVGDFGQEAPHLDLGMDAGFQLAVNLD